MNILKNGVFIFHITKKAASKKETAFPRIVYFNL